MNPKSFLAVCLLVASLSSASNAMAQVTSVFQEKYAGCLKGVSGAVTKLGQTPTFTVGDSYVAVRTSQGLEVHSTAGSTIVGRLSCSHDRNSSLDSAVANAIRNSLDLLFPLQSGEGDFVVQTKDQADALVPSLRECAKVDGVVGEMSKSILRRSFGIQSSGAGMVHSAGTTAKQ